MSKTKVLSAKSHSEVILEDFEGGKAEQLWTKGEPDAQSYFTLKSRMDFDVPMFLTAISKSDLEIRGKITQEEYY